MKLQVTIVAIIWFCSLLLYGGCSMQKVHRSQLILNKLKAIEARIMKLEHFNHFLNNSLVLKSSCSAQPERNNSITEPKNPTTSPAVSTTQTTEKSFNLPRYNIFTGSSASTSTSLRTANMAAFSKSSVRSFYFNSPVDKAFSSRAPKYPTISPTVSTTKKSLKLQRYNNLQYVSTSTNPSTATKTTTSESSVSSFKFPVFEDYDLDLSFDPDIPPLIGN